MELYVPPLLQSDWAPKQHVVDEDPVTVRLTITILKWAKEQSELNLYAYVWIYL